MCFYSMSRKWTFHSRSQRINTSCHTPRIVKRHFLQGRWGKKFKKAHVHRRACRVLIDARVEKKSGKSGDGFVLLSLRFPGSAA